MTDANTDRKPCGCGPNDLCLHGLLAGDPAADITGMEWWGQPREASPTTNDNTADVVLTELRKAIRVEAGDYLLIINEFAMHPGHLKRLGEVAEELWKQNIRLHTVLTSDVNAIRCVRVETPETIKVE